jgi:hypothetical protein
MRAENAAAVANFLVVLLIAFGATAASWLTGGANAVVYAYPVRAAIRTILSVLLVAIPLAAIVSWRTWEHAKRVIAGESRGWRGVLEAGAVGFALTLPVVLPGVIVRQFDPGPWGQPRAFLLGLGYVGVYGFIGLAVGLVAGFVLRTSALAALILHRRASS